MTDNDGFTLIELLIVLAIVAILALIAYPLYTSYVRQAQRSDAKAALLETAQQMERYYTAHNRYPTQSELFPTKADQKSPQKYWEIAVTEADNQHYTLTATKTSGTPETDCKTMTINNTGTRTPEKCWNSN